MLYRELHKMLNCFLEQIGLRVPSKKLEEFIEIQQGILSFDTIRNILLDFGISSKSYQLTSAELKLFDPPFLVQIKKEGGTDFLIVKTFDSEQVQGYLSTTEQISFSRKDFDVLFSGFILIPFTDEYSGYWKEITSKREKRIDLKSWGLKLFVSSIIILSIILLFYNYLSVVEGLLLLLKCLGVWLSYQIIKIEMNREDGFLQRVCDTHRCKEVLHSKMSEPFRGFAMGDLGMIYFSSSLFLLVGNSLIKPVQEVYACLFLSALCALPYTLFSIYYQKFKLKKWCPFCLSVIGILWLDVIVLSLEGIQVIKHLNVVMFCYLIVWCSLAIYLTGLLRSFWIEQGKGTRERQFVHYVKQDLLLFQSILAQKKSWRDFPENIHIPTITSNQSSHEILLLLSPSCPSCVKIYKQALIYMEKFPNLASCSICFKSFEKESNENQVIDWMYSAYLSHGIKGMSKVHNIWIHLENKFLSEFERQVLSEGFILDQRAIEMRIQHSNWSESIGLNSAPTLTYNRKILPRWYLFTDLLTLLIRIEHEKY